MQVEHKTEKGIILLFKVPDDATQISISDQNGLWYRQGKFWGNECPVRVNEGFQLIGLTSEITEDQAKMIVESFKQCNINRFADYNKSYHYYDNALESFKSLMLHLRINESEKWVVLFKPNEK